jgi:hypothetical protein
MAERQVFPVTFAYAHFGQNGNSTALLGKIERFGEYTKTTSTQNPYREPNNVD